MWLWYNKVDKIYEGEFYLPRFLIFNSIFILIFLTLAFSRDNLFLLIYSIFLFVFSLIKFIYPTYPRLTFRYFLFLNIRILISTFLNHYLILLLLAPEIISLLFFFIKLGAISMASISASLVLYFILENTDLEIVGLSLVGISIFLTLLTLHYFSFKSLKYVPKRLRSLLYVLYKVFYLDVLYSTIYKKINEKIVNISCWLQYFIVVIVSSLNIILLTKQNIFSFLISLIMFLVLLVVILGFLYYYKFKKVSLLKLGTSIFLAWTEEFGYLSQIALKLYRNRKLLDKNFILTLFKNKNFIYLVLLINLAMIFYATYSIYWLLNFKIKIYFIKYFGNQYLVIYYILMIIGLIYLIYTYIRNYLSALKKYRHIVRDFEFFNVLIEFI